MSAEIQAGLRNVRHQIAERLVPALINRFEAQGRDVSPIVIEGRHPGLQLRDAVSEIASALSFSVTYLDASTPIWSHYGPSSTSLLDSEDIACDVLLISGWEANQDLARKLLLTSLAQRRPEQIIVIAGVSHAPSPPLATEIGQIVGPAIWQEMTHIEVKTPPALAA